MSVVRSASGEGLSPSRASRAETKRSIGFRTQDGSSTSGGSGRTGGRKDQWSLVWAADFESSVQLAPWSIQACQRLREAWGGRRRGRRRNGSGGSRPNCRARSPARHRRPPVPKPCGAGPNRPSASWGRGNPGKTRRRSVGCRCRIRPSGRRRVGASRRVAQSPRRRIQRGSRRRRSWAAHSPRPGSRISMSLNRTSTSWPPWS
jgi:hypothetical protein